MQGDGEITLLQGGQVILRPCDLLQQAVDDFDLKAIQFLFFVTAAAEECLLVIGLPFQPSLSCDRFVWRTNSLIFIGIGMLSTQGGYMKWPLTCQLNSFFSKCLRQRQIDKMT